MQDQRLEKVEKDTRKDSSSSLSDLTEDILNVTNLIGVN